MSVADKLLTIANNTQSIAHIFNSKKITATGNAIRSDNVWTVEHSLGISSMPGETVNVYGKNLADYTKATGRNASQKVEIVDDGVVWKAGGNYYFEIPLTLPAGVTVRGSWVTEPNAAGEEMQAMRLAYEDNTNAALINGGANYAVTVTKPVKGLYFYKYTVATALTQDLLVSNIQLEIGNTITGYEPYKGMQTATADENGNVVGLKSVAPTMAVISDEVAVECTYFPQSVSGIYEKCQEIKAKELELKSILGGILNGE